MDVICFGDPDTDNATILNPIIEVLNGKYVVALAFFQYNRIDNNFELQGWNGWFEPDYRRPWLEVD